MKISGFTVIRNARLMGYPILESIQSLLPLVDEFVIGVGQSDDDTKDMILSINSPKLKLFDSFWDPSKTQGGYVLSEKTNEALARCQNDWCFYLQADEVLHENDLPLISSALNKFKDRPDIQGVLFHYIHFYSSYQVVATSRKWYRNEVRLVKKSTGIQSHGDAQGFRVNGQKPQVIHCGAHVYHYGWVKPPQLMGQKNKLLSRWWHGNKKDEAFNNFQYEKQYGLKPFTGTHPQIMKSLVEKQDWSFDHNRSISNWTLKDLNLWASDLFEKVFRHRIGEYKPYRLIKPQERK